MFGRKRKIMLRYSAFSAALEVLSSLIIIFMLSMAVTLYPQVGETFPIEFGSSGEILREVPRATALFHPVMAVIFYVIITGACLAVRQSTPPDTPCPRLAAALNGVALCKCVYLLHETGVTYCNMSLFPVFPWLLPAAIAAGAVIVALCAIHIIKVSKKQKYTLEGEN